MTELNNTEPIKVTNLVSEKQFEISSTETFKPYIKGGKAKIVTLPTYRNYSSFKECYSNHLHTSQYHFRDFTKSNRKALLQLATLTLFEFNKRENIFPKLFNQLHLRLCLRLAQRLNKSIKLIDKIDKLILTKIFSISSIQIGAIASIWGGIIAQEVLKVTGKYLSIFQLAYLDFCELAVNDKIPRSIDRYFGLNALIGEDLVQKLQKQNIQKD